jgi:putative DNA primase/helicase
MANESGGGFDDDGERHSLRLIHGGVQGEARPLEPDPWLAAGWLLSHDAVVEIFMHHGGERFLFFKVMGEVFHWTGHVWELDQCCKLENMVGALCNKISVAQKKKPARVKLEDTTFLNKCAGRVRQLVASPLDMFDKSEVFNATSATISMKANGSHEWQLGPQRREDYCSKIAGTTPERGPCPTWLAFLDQITAGNADMIAYLQRVAGYCASPFTSEQAFFFFYGSGGNGKGAFLRTIAAVLGDYATTASLDLFLLKKFEGIPEELASLRGVRMVVASETGVGRRWDESKIKQVSGGDQVRARFMAKNSFVYVPQFKIIVSGNDQPTIADTGPALRRRLQMVPFNVTVAPDPELEKRMLAEAPAILAWVLDGFTQWREQGLNPPTDVVTATDEYFEAQDERGHWFDTACKLDLEWWESTEAVFKSWKRYAMANGCFVGSQAQCTQWVKSRHKLATKSTRPKGGGNTMQCLLGMMVSPVVDESIGSTYRDDGR